MRKEPIEDLDTPGHKEYFEAIKFLDNLEYGNFEDFLRICKKASGNREELFVAKSWPINAFTSSEVPDDADLLIFELKFDYPQDVFLFETILNSKLGRFYFEIKCCLGEHNHSIDVQHINQFPVPNLRNGQGMEKLLKSTFQLRSLDPGSSHYQDLQQEIDVLVFELYELVDYDIKMIEHYYLEKNRNVTEKDIQKYCAEFIVIFRSFIKKGYVLNPEWAVSEFGVAVKFSTSRDGRSLQYNKDLERLDEIMEDSGIECKIKEIPEGKKIRFYSESGSLYICKSNRLENWTKFMGIIDSRKCLWELFDNLK